MSFRYYFENNVLYIHCGNLPDEAVATFIRNRKEDILTKYEEHQKLRNRIHRPYDFVTGEKISILGTTVTLKVIKSVTNSVRLTPDELILSVTDPTKPMLCRKVYDDWKAERLTEVVNTLTPALYDKLNKLGAPIPRQVICTKHLPRNSAGYCYRHRDPEGKYFYTIKLSTKLLELPIWTINAVFAHELAHTTYMGHKKHFYSLLTELCPGWGVWDKYTFEKWFPHM